MIALTSVDAMLIGLFALAAVIAMVRVLRHASSRRARLALLQLPCALLLVVALLLPEDRSTTGLLVLTRGAAFDPRSDSDSNLPAVALPGATRVDGVASMPDLATALRRFPGVTHVLVRGGGLELHDREALAGRDLSFEPSPSDRGPALIQLDAPESVAAGSPWHVRGRLSGMVSRVQLVDPAQRVIAESQPDAEGRFALTGLARAAGSALFTLRLRAGATTLHEQPLPVHATQAAPMRVRLLAAVPSPDLKYLRRWALDAGVELDARIALAPNLTQTGSTAGLDAAALAQLDLLIVDERSWPQLARQRELLRTAVADGLGLLVRITGPVPNAALQDWRALGLTLAQSAQPPRALQLDAEIDRAPDSNLHGWQITPEGTSQVTLLSDATGAPLATQVLLGQGRIGALWLLDSFRLHTRGQRERHASLWADLFTSLARARNAPKPVLPTRASVGRRAILCRPDGDLQIRTPDAAILSLLRDPSNPGCAAFWPTAAGWHTLLPAAVDAVEEATGAAAAGDGDLGAAPFYVFDPTRIRSLIDQQTQVATAALVNRDRPPAPHQVDREPGRRALLASWLLLTALLWWQERRAGTAERGAG